MPKINIKNSIMVITSKPLTILVYHSIHTHKFKQNILVKPIFRNGTDKSLPKDTLSTRSACNKLTFPK